MTSEQFKVGLAELDARIANAETRLAWRTRSSGAGRTSTVRQALNRAGSPDEGRAFMASALAANNYPKTRAVEVTTCRKRGSREERSL